MERRPLAYFDEGGDEGISRIAVENFTQQTSNIHPPRSSPLSLLSIKQISTKAWILIILSLIFLLMNCIWLLGGQPGKQSSHTVSAGGSAGLDSLERAFLSLTMPRIPSSLTDKASDVADSIWDKDRNYGIVIDAGSSGSRVYVYSWVNPSKSSSISTDSAIKIEKSDASGLNFELKSQPGLSSFSSDPSGVGGHLDPLLRFAQKTIPESKRAGTPLYLFATAGMRLVDPEPRNQILSTACSHVKQNFDYWVGDCQAHFKVISGELEGILGWLTVNYLKTKFTKSKESPGSYGFIDMGGASAQIAFEPTEKMSKIHQNDLQKVSLRKLNGQQEDRNVFVTTFLGFGANKARERYIEKYATANAQFSDPCVYKGLENVEDNVPISGTGNFAECYLKVSPLLNKGITCSDDPCLFNGVHAPIEDFKNHKFVGVSELWYTTSSAYDLGGPYNYEKIESASEKLCDTPWKNITDLVAENKLPHVDGTSRMKLQCFKSAYLLNVLHEGFGIPKNHDDPLLETIDDLDGFSVSWTLGAAFLLASSSIPSPDNGLIPNASGHLYSSIFFLALIIGAVVWYHIKSSKVKSNPYTDLSRFHSEMESSFDSLEAQKNDNARGLYK